MQHDIQLIIPAANVLKTPIIAALFGCFIHGVNITQGGAIAAPMLFVSVMPRSTTLPIVAAVSATWEKTGSGTSCVDSRIAPAPGDRHTVGLRSDGTVVATGANGNGRCNISDWKNIRLPEQK